MVKRYQTCTSQSVQFRLSDLQALLLSEPILCAMEHRPAVKTAIRQLVHDRGFLEEAGHPYFYRRTEAGTAALLLFLHFGGVIADRSRL